VDFFSSLDEELGAFEASHQNWCPVFAGNGGQASYNYQSPTYTPQPSPGGWQTQTFDPFALNSGQQTTGAPFVADFSGPSNNAAFVADFGAPSFPASPQYPAYGQTPAQSQYMPSSSGFGPPQAPTPFDSPYGSAAGGQPSTNFGPYNGNFAASTNPFAPQTGTGTTAGFGQLGYGTSGRPATSGIAEFDPLAWK
jgi:hypothetical protein